VTGAGGFIGSHLVEALATAGAQVRALIRYTSRADAGNLEFLPSELRDRVEIVRGNLCDAQFMHEVCSGQQIVFHLGALIGIPYSYQAASDYAATNVGGTINVLEACRRHGVQRVIHTSTSETYGTAQYRPIDEKHPLVAQSPYAASKIGADKMAESYFRSFGTPVVIVRPFNTFGPRQSARAVIPTILCQLYSNRQRLRLGSLEPERDLTFVSDTVEGFLALGLCDAAVGRTLNLGTGTAVTVGDLARRCMQIAGRELPIELDSERVRPEDSEVMALVSDRRAVNKLCGWEPRITLDEGLRRTAEFVRLHLRMYRPEEYQR
jgi:UDP-glucose 4-epimerase